jgi:hypothetical protein
VLETEQLGSHFRIVDVEHRHHEWISSGDGASYHHHLRALVNELLLLLLLHWGSPARCKYRHHSGVVGAITLVGTRACCIQREQHNCYWLEWIQNGSARRSAVEQLSRRLTYRGTFPWSGVAENTCSPRKDMPPSTSS